MANSDKLDTRTAHSKSGRKLGDKTIEITVRLWTDGIASEGAIIQKNAWDSGVVYLKENKLHGISSKDTHTFNSLFEMQVAVAKALAQQRVVLHPSPKSQKIYKPKR